MTDISWNPWHDMTCTRAVPGCSEGCSLPSSTNAPLQSRLCWKAERFWKCLGNIGRMRTTTKIRHGSWQLGAFHWGGQPLAPYLHEPRPGWSPACSTGGAEFDEPERKTGRQISKWDIRTYWKMCVYKPGISFGMRCKLFACSNSVILLGNAKKTVFWRIRPGSAYILSVNTFHNRVPTVFGGWWFPSSKATMSARTLPIHKISHSALDPLLLDYVGLNLVWFWDWVRYEPNSPNVWWILGLRAIVAQTVDPCFQWRVEASSRGFCCNVWNKSFQCCCGPRGPHAQVPSSFGWVGHLDFLNKYGKISRYPDRLASFMDLGERWSSMLGGSFTCTLSRR